MLTRAQSGFPAVVSVLAIIPSVFAAAQQKVDSIPPVELVRQAVKNEISSNEDSGGPHFMFKDTRKTTHLNQVKLVVETKEATAGLLIAQDGHPLTSEERKQEETRLANYIQNPQELSKKRKQEKEDADHTMRILKALPKAFLYDADGTENGTVSVGHAGHELVRLKFHPNPSYDPPSKVEQVLTGMQGYVLIDDQEKRLAQINATLEKEVGFGWGILGHLDRGGRFLVQQADVGKGQWEITRMELSLTGKILLFKKLNIQSTDIFSDFHPVPSGLTFAQGVEMLKKEADRGTSAGTAPVNHYNPGKNNSARQEADANIPHIH